jgi:hypothetical protein
MTNPADLKIINLWAGPGAGKSTTAAGLFNLMKSLGMSVEYVTEVAKDLTYQRDAKALENQLFILANQDMRLRRLVGEVEWVITDSPLPLCLAYITGEYEEWLEEAIEGAYYRYTNFDVLVRRVKPYHTYGRNQTEAEARALDLKISDLFHDFSEDSTDLWLEVDGDLHAPRLIAAKFGFLDEPGCPLGGYGCDHLPPDGTACSICGEIFTVPPMLRPKALLPQLLNSDPKA